MSIWGSYVVTWNIQVNHQKVPSLVFVLSAVRDLWWGTVLHRDCHIRPARTDIVLTELSSLPRGKVSTPSRLSNTHTHTHSMSKLQSVNALLTLSAFTLSSCSHSKHDPQWYPVLSVFNLTTTFQPSQTFLQPNIPTSPKPLQHIHCCILYISSTITSIKFKIQSERLLSITKPNFTKISQWCHLISVMLCFICNRHWQCYATETSDTHTRTHTPSNCCMHASKVFWEQTSGICFTLINTNTVSTQALQAQYSHRAKNCRQVSETHT